MLEGRLRMNTVTRQDGVKEQRAEFTLARLHGMGPGATSSPAVNPAAATAPAPQRRAPAAAPPSTPAPANPAPAAPAGAQPPTWTTSPLVPDLPDDDDIPF
jgi:single-stranded DNA-binding protein